MKQTAVEWLEYKLANTPTEELVFLWRNIFDQAKAMEKEQINDACYYGYYTEEMYDTRNYYNETYSK